MWISVSYNFFIVISVYLQNLWPFPIKLTLTKEFLYFFPVFIFQSVVNTFTFQKFQLVKTFKEKISGSLCFSFWPLLLLSKKFIKNSSYHIPFLWSLIDVLSWSIPIPPVQQTFHEMEYDIQNMTFKCLTLSDFVKC